MSGKGIATVIIGVVAFIAVEFMINAFVTGTGAGSVILSAVLTVVLAAAIILAVIKTLD